MLYPCTLRIAVAYGDLIAATERADQVRAESAVTERDQIAEHAFEHTLLARAAYRRDRRDDSGLFWWLLAATIAFERAAGCAA